MVLLDAVTNLFQIHPYNEKCRSKVPRDRRDFQKKVIPSRPASCLQNLSRPVPSILLIHPVPSCPALLFKIRSRPVPRTGRDGTGRENPASRRPLSPMFFLLHLDLLLLQSGLFMSLCILYNLSNANLQLFLFIFVPSDR